jgi:hypothetical protein
LQDQPLPVVELQRLDHREQQDRQRKRGGEYESAAQVGAGIALVLSATHRRAGLRRQRGLVTGLADRRDQVGRRDPLGIEADRGPLGGEVDRRLDPLDLVQPLLDPARAGGAGHALDRQADPLLFGGAAHRATSRPNSAVCTVPPSLN